MEELKKLRAAQKAKKAAKKEDKDKPKKSELPAIGGSSLPALNMGPRRGGFEMIPDFLNKKQTLIDQTNLNDMDMMQAALDKQQTKNENQPSMAELFRQKTEKATKELEASKASGPSKSDVADRKARLLAQRDALRKAKEQKRQEELSSFNAATETKADLFNELKKMDEGLKLKEASKQGDPEAARKLEMFRKVRADMKEETK